MKEKMTLEKLEKQIAEGRGVGLGDSYLPWIRFKKRDTSAYSNQSLVPMPNLKRLCYFLSGAERRAAHVLWWIGASDVREQFPLWPWPHPHPLQEIDPATERQRHPGMCEVARAAGIRLFNYQGLKIPTVLSIDLLVTPSASEGMVPSFLGVSCKPASVYHKAGACDRTRERLELDRLYCMSAGFRHLLIHPEQLPRMLTVQLDWLAPLATRAFISNLTESSEYRTFIERVVTRVYTTSADTVAREESKDLNWSREFAQFVMRTAMWRQDIDVDLLQPITMTSPLKPGGRALRTVLRSRFFGDTAWT